MIAGLCVLLAALTWTVFGQTLKYGFVNYDDNTYVYDNDIIKGGLTLEGIKWAFTHVHSGNWHPLTSMSHMLDCQLYGLNAGGHHFTNVILHTIAVILLFLLLRQMTGALWRSAFVAALFAIHPLRVESVAWVSERKDVLSGVFFMLTLIAYLYYTRKPFSLLRYLSVGALFALGLMAKPMLVTLPFVLLLIDYWPLNRFTPLPTTRNKARRSSRGSWQRLSIPQSLVLEKLPLLVLSAASSAATLLAQQQAIHSSEGWPLVWRVNNALVSCLTYIGQMFWPLRLAVFYPHPKGSLPIWQGCLSLAVLLVISVVVFLGRRRRPYLLAGWAWFLVMLVPIIGIVQAGWQGHADRYTYLPEIGLYLMITWYVAGLTASWPKRREFLGAVAATVIAFLTWSGWKQTSYWRDSESLWTHALAVTSDNNDVAHRGLGIVLLHRGQVEAAIDHDRAALRLRPGNPDAHTNLANALLEKGNTDEAISHYQAALHVLPNDATIHANLGNAFLRGGQLDEAIAQYTPALSERANYPGAHYNLAVALFRQGRLDEAIDHFRETVKLQPDHPDAYNDLAIALFQKGQPDEAISAWNKAVEIKPGNAEAHNNLGVALMQKGRTREAIDQWQKTLQIEPEKIGTQLTLAWVLATSPEASLRDGHQALTLARHAQELSGNHNPMTFRVLAAAYAETGKFPEAIGIAQQGIQLASGQDQPGIAGLLRADLASYQQNLPLRENNSTM